MLRNRWLHKLKLTGVLLALGALLAACGGGDGGGKALAVYQNAAGEKEQTVTEKEFDAFVNVNLFLNQDLVWYQQLPGFREDMLRQYIGFKVLGSRLGQAETKDAEAKAKDEVGAFRDAYGEQVAAGLTSVGLGFDDLEDYVTLYTKATSYLEKEIAEEEIQAKYDETVAANPNAFMTATVSHILIKTVDPQTQEEVRSNEEALEIAEEVRQKLLDGGDFAELAAEYSEDDGSKNNGGTYTNYNVNEWVPGFREATIELPLNEISEPVETTFGYHIIKVTERNEPTYEDVKAGIRAEVVTEKFVAFLNDEVDALIVENNLPKEETPANDGGGNGEAGEDALGDGEPAGDESGDAAEPSQTE